MKGLLILFLVFSLGSLYSQDSFCVHLNKPYVNTSDTVQFVCDLSHCGQLNMKYATLNLWIENIQNHTTWKYRYPIINSRAKGMLIIDTSITQGSYAFNFLLQKNFFNLEGKIDNYTNTGKEMEYMFNSDSISFTKSFMPNPDGTFKLKPLFFEGVASFVFYPNSGQEGYIQIMHIRSSLDSFFVPMVQYTRVLQVGEGFAINNNAPASEYRFNDASFKMPVTLPDISVTTKSKKITDKLNERYATGIFKGSEASIIDCIHNNTISQYPSFIEFLKGRIAGLMIENLSDNKYFLTWRGRSDLNKNKLQEFSNVDIFIDEQQQDLRSFNWNVLDTHDIAMIKAFPPPAFLSAGGSNGAIVVYTRKGEEEENEKHGGSFVLFGYTPSEMIWKR